MMEFYRISVSAVFIMLVVLPSASARARQCSDLFADSAALNKLNHIIPKMPGIYDRLEEVGQTPTSEKRGSGAIHQFIRKPNRRAHAIGGFDIFQERILFAPLWAAKFGLTLKGDILEIPDIAGLNDLIENLNLEKDRAATSLRAVTYSKPGAIGILAFARLWRARQFVIGVVVTPENYYTHDFLNHGLYGYLALPASLVDRSADWAELLLDLYDESVKMKNERLRAHTYELLTQLVSFLDASTESMGGAMMDRAGGAITRAEHHAKLAKVFSGFNRFNADSIETKSALRSLRSLLPRTAYPWLNAAHSRLGRHESLPPDQLADQYLAFMGL